jgi:cell division protein FtsL
MRITKAEMALIVVTILFINVCLLVPVWQSARNSQLRMSLARTEQELREREEEKMVLSASIARKTTPEYLIEQAAVQNIVFTQIGAETSSFVARADDIVR